MELQSGLTIAAFAFLTAIILLWLTAARRALEHTRRYRDVEGPALTFVAEKLARTRAALTAQPSAATDKPMARRELVSIASLQEGLSKSTVVADRLATIKRMRESRVKVSMAALQEMTIAREATAPGMSLPSFSANLSMMLGLLGTVVGLTIMVQQISAVLPTNLGEVTTDTWAASVNQIRGVLGGMRTGFTATLTGLLSAITLSLLNYRLAGSQSAFLERLDRFTAADLLPATVQATEDASILEEVSFKLEESFSTLDSIWKNHQDALKELSALQKGFNAIIDSIRMTTKVEASERIQGIVGKLTALIDQMSEISKGVFVLTDSVPHLVRETERANAAGLTRVDRMIEVYEHQRALGQWPLQVKVVFGFLAVLNLMLIAFILLR